MEVKEINISDIKPYKNNPRNNDDAVDYVANSIKEFGFKQPIVLDKDNIIVIGHTRLKASKKLGLKKVPCIYADDLTEDQIKALRLADNKVGEVATWDEESLVLEIDDIELDLEPFGFEINLFDDEEPEVVEDEVPDIPEEPKAKLGDIYQLGEHRLMCGDSTSEEDVAKLMDGAKADMVFTDPPYGVSYTEKNEFLNSIGGGDRLTYAIENDDKTPEDMYEFWVTCFTNLEKFTTNEMSYYITAPQGGDLLLLLLQAIRDSGFALKHQLVWNKNNHVLGRCDYNYKHEPIIFGWKIKGKHKFYGKGHFKTSVWDIDKPISSKLHPTMKPIELISETLLNSSAEKDKVIDLFGGSGSTLIACEQLNRQCYMMEYDPHYIDVIIERWENLTGRKAEKIDEVR